MNNSTRKHQACFQPRPPIQVWPTTQNMLRHVFSSMHNRQAKDFLLRTAPLTDVKALMSPTCLSHGISGSSVLRDPHDCGVAMQIPMGMIGELALGMRVQSFVPSETVRRFNRNTDLLFHTVTGTP